MHESLHVYLVSGFLAIYQYPVEGFPLPAFVIVTMWQSFPSVDNIVRSY